MTGNRDRVSRNVAGTALYDQCGLPEPGRLLRFGLRAF